MQIPKHHETYIPILQVLHDKGKLHYNDLRKQVRDTFYSNLPEDLLSKKTTTGDLLILNRIGWGKSYLKQGKFIEYPERGMVQITPKGEAALKKGSLSRDDLQKDPDFLAYQEFKISLKNEEKTTNIENESPQELIDSGINAIETQVKSDLLEKFKSMDPYFFEKVILILLKKMGYGDFMETSKSRDGGIDGIINQDQLGVEKIYIQAKRYGENKVRENDIRNFIGAMSDETYKGIFVTTSSFDDSAVKKAHEARHTIILIDGKKLVNLMHEYGVGVQIRNTYEIKEVDEDFFEAI